MPFLSLDTLGSSPDENGNRHRLSIDALRSKVKNNVTVYEAMAFSYSKLFDPRDRNLVIAKFPKKQDSHSWAQCELEKSELARSMASKFKDYVQHTMATTLASRCVRETEINFLKIQTASLDSTSIVDRKRKKGECFVFEDVLEGFTNFMDGHGEAVACSRRGRRSRRETISKSDGRGRSEPISIPAAIERCVPSAPPAEFDSPPSYEESELSEVERVLASYLATTAASSQDSSSNNGGQSHLATLAARVERRLSELRLNSARTVPDINNNSRETDDDIFDDSDVSYPVLQAFVHFVFCQTHGQAIVCGLKGTQCERGFTMTTPVFHSLRREFGCRDGGESAVRAVIANHRCSRLCHHLPEMFTMLRRASR
ncbi:alpha-protein kinase vwka [Plakobranchus ocellatus]|uniref:Alpha-protein kinase vwka n=1 Tax=Plakobranchus ocellatus TaxID=259542 RepID=A0AAV3Z3W7_9GAST|nr:alpha-protein kinase vwka [Plakobranchus ocellatus]